jgi:hypothetical protein
MLKDKNCIEIMNPICEIFSDAAPAVRLDLRAQSATLKGSGRQATKTGVSIRHTILIIGNLSPGADVIGGVDMSFPLQKFGETLGRRARTLG